MQKITGLLALLLVVFNSVAQTRTVKGRVVDSASNVPVELATVAVLTVKDTTSALISYTVSDKKGDFTLRNMPAGVQLKILVSFVSYNSYRKLFILGKTENLDLGTIKVSAKQLHEVIIKGERPPIVIRADTIEFAAEAFKTRPNAAVEDLLKKLPGVEVSMEGFVTVNGRRVSKILVDGHEFFSNDPRIATKNLDAEMIDKVQVYDDREFDPNHLVPNPNVDKIINLKFKKAYKKSIFGKIFAGAGTEDRFETGGLINMFRDTLQVSLLGVSNNLNNTGFSFSDLYTSGGANRGGSNALGRAGLSSFGNSNSGIQKIISGGVNINNDYGKTLKINLAYYYTHIINTYNTISSNQRLLNDTNLVTNTQTTRQSFDNRHNLTSSVKWQPNPSTIFTYTPSISFSDNNSGSNIAGNTFSNFIPAINNSLTSDNNTGNNAEFQQSFNYNHKFKKSGESLSVSHSLSISPNGGNDYNINNLTSYTLVVPSYLLNRYTNTDNKGFDANVSVSYNYPVSKKLNAAITLADAYHHQINNTSAYDLDTLNGRYDLFLQTLSSALARNTWTENLTPSITYNIKENVSFTATLNLQDLYINNQFDRNYPDINQHFFDVLPNANLTVGKFGLGYSAGFNTPNIGDMIPYSVIYSPLYSVTGNPDLKPSRRNNFTFRYSNYLSQSQISINGNLNASFEENGIFRQRTLDNVGIETSRPINMTGRYNLSANGYLNKRFKKQGDFSFSQNSNLSAGKSHTFFELNGQNGYQDSYSASFSESFNASWKELIDIDASYRFVNSITNYTGVDYNTVKNLSHVADTHFIFFWTKQTSIEGTYTYTYNPVVSPGFQKSTNLLNFNIAHTFLKKDRGQIKFTCYDILNQNVGSIRSVSENTITDTQSQIIKRYFLVTLQYKFNKAIAKK